MHTASSTSRRSITRFAQQRWSSSAPRVAKSSITAESEAATTLVFEKTGHNFVVDEPVALGGKGTGPSPLAHFLGSLIGCTQITLHTIAQEKQIKIGKVRWQATGKFDLRGLRGEPETHARFQEIHILGELETYFPERRLSGLADEIKQRCIIHSTIGSSPHTKLTTELKASPRVFKSSMGHWIDQH